jgi:Uma2 family endonuclease
MFTIYDPDKKDFLQVEEPDPSLRYTYADYLKWSFEERLELFRGKIFKLSAPNTRHQEISGNLFYKVRNYLTGKACKIFAAPFDVRLPMQNKKRDNEVITVVQPDICVICDMSKLDDKGCCGAPDMVVEILSTGNSRKEVQDKFQLYEEAGVNEYWIINPEENIIIYNLQNGKFIGSKAYAPGKFITSSVLKGIEIDVADIFKY